MSDIQQDWLHEYALLALRIDRLVKESSGQSMLIYTGPDDWQEEVAQEERTSAAQLVDHADRLIKENPFHGRRATYLNAQLRAMRAVSRQLGGETLSLIEYAHECLGFKPKWLSETLFEEAHAQLDAALPKSGDSLASRLQTWQSTYTLKQKEKLLDLMELAVTEARKRTNALLALPEEESLDLQRMDNPYMLAGGHYHGNLKSTLFINDTLPFNLADLLYVATHESYPGHIAESVLKDIHLVQEKGYIEQQVQFMLSPQFVMMEGLGLVAEEVVFPGDEAQAWLTENIFKPLNIKEDGSQIAAIHHVKNVFWGVWANAALMVDQGATDQEVKDYLAQWALLNDQELEQALPIVKSGPYLFCYYYGWDMLRKWLELPRRNDEKLRRALTEQLLPDDLIDEC